MDSLNHDDQADVIQAFNWTLGTSMIFCTLTFLILKVWSIKFIHLNYS